MVRATSGAHSKARFDQGKAKTTSKVSGRPARQVASRIESQRVGVVVLGMHRSGTSALTRMLSLLGCALPKNLLEANPTNPSGHWEPLAVCAYNDQILQATGHEWFDWLPVDESWSRSLVYEQQVQAAQAILREEYGEAPLFVLKDPRMCRLAGLWLDALDGESVTPAVVIALRNPMDVADSLARRDGSDASVSLLVWLRHVLDAERATRGRNRVFVTYDDLLTNWGGVAQRIGAGLGLVFPRSGAIAAEEIDAFLNPSLRHHAHSPCEIFDNPLLSSWIRRAYDVFFSWAAGAETLAGARELDAVRAALDEAGPAFARPLRALAREKVRICLLEQEKQTLIERITELDGALGERLAALEAMRNEVVVMDERRDVAERCIIELDAALQASNGERDALVNEIVGLRVGLGEMDQAAREARAQALRWENEVQQATATLRTTQHRLAELESAMAQRQEELGQVWADLEAERQRNVELITATQVVQDELTNVVFDAKTARGLLVEAHEAALAQAQSDFQELKNHFMRFREEATAEAVALSRLLQAAEAETQRAQDDLAGVRRNLDQTTDAAMEARNDMAELHQRLEQAAVEREALTQRLQVVEQDSLKALAGRVQAEQQVGERFSEIAAMTGLLREQTVKAQRNSDQAGWLLAVHNALQRCPRWWALMPKRWQQAKKTEWLGQLGLFDAAAYISRYPDVAADGMDPLRHYMLFGLVEGRQR